MNLYGRRTIYASKNDFSNDSDLIDVLEKALSVHRENEKEISYLFKYVKGEQPILKRTKNVRSEICNKIVENHALEINNFKIGFMFGEPVQYVRRGDCKISKANNDKEGVASLNEYVQLDSKSEKDREIAEWFNTCGLAYRMILPTETDEDELPFTTYVLDPRNTFVIRSNDFKKKPILAVTYSNISNIENSKTINILTVYSDDFIWEVSLSTDEKKILNKEKNPIGMIPIVEYKNNPNMMGSFETVISLCNALNTIVSNGLDAVEQDVQSLIWFNNCEISKETFDKLKDIGAIQTKSDAGNPVNISVIKTDLNQSETQVLKDDLYQKLLTIASVPDRRASAGGNTGQALIIGEGWVMAEASAKALEPLFISSERQTLRLMLKVCEGRLNACDSIKKLKLHDIDIKFTRNKTDNLLVKTQALVSMLQAGIHPRIAIAHCGLFSDPEQVYIDSKETLEAIKTADNSALSNTVSNVVSKADGQNSDPLTDEVFKLIDNLTGGGTNANK